MIFALLLFITAISISGIAAYFSVVGLISIFSAQPLAIALMGGSLELGKLVAASFLYRNWIQINVLMRTYLVSAILLLSFITSLGIFGYLSNAHSTNTVSQTDNIARIQTLETRISQEQQRLDILLQQSGRYDGPVRRLEREIKQTQDRITALTEEMLPLKEQYNANSAKTGAIRYITGLIYDGEKLSDQERAIQILIFLIIIVFDPLAILLVIAGNMQMGQTPTDRYSWRGLRVDPARVYDIDAIVEAKRRSLQDQQTG